MSGARVYVYKEIEDIVTNNALTASKPADGQGVYALNLPAGRYYFISKGTKDGIDYFAYHGNNPIQIQEGKLWLAFMVNPLKPPVYTDGLTSLKGLISFKGTPVQEAFVTLYKAGTKTLKGVGTRTDAARDDGAFSLAAPAGKYNVIARKMEGARKIKPLSKGDLYCYYPRNPIEVIAGKTVTIEVPCYPVQARETFTGTPKIKGNEVETLASQVQLSRSGIQGMVLNSEGKPLPGLTVLAFSGKSIMHHLANRADFVARTDREGKYTLPINADGEYYIIVRSSLSGTPQPGDIFGVYQDAAKPTVTFKKGQMIENVNIHISETKDDRAKLRLLSPNSTRGASGR